MTAIPIHYFVMLAGVVFAIGAVGFVLRRNLIVTLLSLELMLNAASLTFVAFNRLHVGTLTGQTNSLFIILFAAGHAAVGLAIAVSFFRARQSMGSEHAGSLRN